MNKDLDGILGEKHKCGHHPDKLPKNFSLCGWCVSCVNKNLARTEIGKRIEERRVGVTEIAIALDKSYEEWVKSNDFVAPFTLQAQALHDKYIIIAKEEK